MMGLDAGHLMGPFHLEARVLSSPFSVLFLENLSPWTDSLIFSPPLSYMSYLFSFALLAGSVLQFLFQPFYSIFHSFPHVCLFVFSFFVGPHLQHMEVPRLGVKSKLQLPAYTRATATPDLSHIFDLHHSLWQCQILTPVSKVRDQTSIEPDTSRVLHPLRHNGDSPHGFKCGLLLFSPFSTTPSAYGNSWARE